MRTSIDDGVAALELAEAATTSWREKRIVDAVSRRDALRGRHRRPRPHGRAPRARTSRRACPGAELVAAYSPVADERDWARNDARRARRSTPTTRSCSPIRERRRGLPRHADDRCMPTQIIAALEGRQARVQREAAVAGPRRLPARRGEARAAPEAEGDDRLRAPLRRELPGRARRASQSGAIGAPVPRALADAATRTTRPASSCKFAPTVRRHLPRHERARHRHARAGSSASPKPVRVFATGTVAVHEGLQTCGDVDNGVAMIEFEGGEMAVLLRVAHDGARARDDDRDHRHRRAA